MLEINISTILLQMANFFILAFILYRFLFQPRRNVLTKRETIITKAMDDAQIVLQDAEGLRQQLTEKTNNIDAEIAARKNEARIVIEKTRQQMLQEVQTRIERIEAQTEEKIAQLRSEAIQEHQEEIGDLASEFATGIMADLMTPQILKLYQDEFLNQISQINLAEYLEGTDPNEVTFIKVITASSTTASYQDHLESILKDKLSQKFNLSYEVEPDLIAGGILRFENELVDGSLKGQINHMRERYQEKA
jgi:F-type H+-transporting ATPase subunit b